MSYRSRLYNHRNAQSMEAINDKPFFPKQHGRNKISNKASFFQAKLSVNEPGDQYEQEADNVANSVVSNKTATPVLQQKKISSIQRLATAPEEEKVSTNDQRMDRDKEKPFQTANAEPEKEKKGIQRMGDPMMEKDKMKGVQKMSDPMMEKDKMKGIQKMSDPMMEKEKMKGVQKMGDPMMEKDKMKGIQKMGDPMTEEEKMKKGTSVQTKHEATTSTASPQVSSKIDNTTGKGNALPPKAMHEMNSSFGFDFSNVRLHNDSEAVTMNKELQAQAFTHGTDIYFNEGKFDPDSAQGKFLLAHELTHVIQQKGELSPELMRDPLGSQVPSQVTPTQASLSFDLPGGKALTGDWNDLSTTNQTTITLTITPTGLRVNFSPALLIDAQWPVSDMEWSGLTYDFATASISSIGLADTQTVAVSAGQGTARSKISSFFISLLSGTPMAKPGYDPLTDTNPRDTLSIIKNNFMKTPSSGGNVTAADVTNVALGASITLTSPIEEGTDEGKLAISGGLSVRATLAGTGADLGSEQYHKVDDVTISGDSIIVKKDDKPVAQLHSFSIKNGGTVTINRMTLLGSPETAGGVESAFRLFGLIAALSGGGPGDRLAVGNSNPDLSPELTEGVVRSQIEKALGAAAVRLIRENANAIPGIDLTSVLGVGQILPPVVPKTGGGVPV